MDISLDFAEYGLHDPLARQDEYKDENSKLMDRDYNFALLSAADMAINSLETMPHPHALGSGPELDELPPFTIELDMYFDLMAIDEFEKPYDMEQIQPQFQQHKLRKEQEVQLNRPVNQQVNRVQQNQLKNPLYQEYNQLSQNMLGQSARETPKLLFEMADQGNHMVSDLTNGRFVNASNSRTNVNANANANGNGNGNGNANGNVNVNVNVNVNGLNDYPPGNSGFGDNSYASDVNTNMNAMNYNPNSMNNGHANFNPNTNTNPYNPVRYGSFLDTYLPQDSEMPSEMASEIPNQTPELFQPTPSEFAYLTPQQDLQSIHSASLMRSDKEANGEIGIMDSNNSRLDPSMIAPHLEVTSTGLHELLPLTTVDSHTPSILLIQLTHHLFFLAHQYITRNLLDILQPPALLNRLLFDHYTKSRALIDLSNLQEPAGRRHTLFANSILNYFPFMGQRTYLGPTSPNQVPPPFDNANQKQNISPNELNLNLSNMASVHPPQPEISPRNRQRHLIRGIFKNRETGKMGTVNEAAVTELFVPEDEKEEEETKKPKKPKRSLFNRFKSQEDSNSNANAMNVGTANAPFGTNLSPSASQNFNNANANSNFNFMAVDNNSSKDSTSMNGSHSMSGSTSGQGASNALGFNGSFNGYNHPDVADDSSVPSASLDATLLNTIMLHNNSSNNNGSTNGNQVAEPDYAALFEGVGKRNLVSTLKSKPKFKEENSASSGDNSTTGTFYPSEKEKESQEDVALPLNSAPSSLTLRILGSKLLKRKELSNLNTMEQEQNQQFRQQASTSKKSSSSLENESMDYLVPDELLSLQSSSKRTSLEQLEKVEVDLELLNLPPDTKTFSTSNRKTRGRKENKVADLLDLTKIFLCSYCLRRFKRQEHLKRHFRLLHTFEKPYECKICHKKFSRSDNLNQHYKIHKSEDVELVIGDMDENEECDMEKT